MDIRSAGETTDYSHNYTLNDIAHACVFVLRCLLAFSLVLRQKRRKCMSSVIVVISCGEQPRTTKMEPRNTRVYKVQVLFVTKG